jgi:hypothetical protein
MAGFSHWSSVLEYPSAWLRSFFFSRCNQCISTCSVNSLRYKITSWVPVRCHGLLLFSFIYKYDPCENTRL